MAKIVSVHSLTLPFEVQQQTAQKITHALFSEKIEQLERYLKVFQNGEIDTRYVCMPLEWYAKDHTFEERNSHYCEQAVALAKEAIVGCLQNEELLRTPVSPSEIDAIFFVSSTGIATPSIEALLMNELPFRNDTKRIPIWGLGCAGGAAGLSRAFDYCQAYPEANVLVVCVELCSLTFQKDDLSKSNIIGISLFSDGVSCALITGSESAIQPVKPVPTIVATDSRLLPDSEDVMGWSVQDSGLHVIFSKSIPAIIEKWLGPIVEQFLSSEQRTASEVNHFIAHPGGKKVLQSYEKTLSFPPEKLDSSRTILRTFGNMSSPTVLYVLEHVMHQSIPQEDIGIIAALGPGFSSELLLVEWT